MKEAEYDKLKEQLKILEDKNIQDITKDILAGYELEDNENDIVFVSKNNDKMILSLDEKGHLTFEKTSDEELQIQTVEEGKVTCELKYEIRPNGIIITRVFKVYGYSIFSKENMHIVDLFSESYVLTSEQINSSYPEIVKEDGSYDVKLFHKKVDIDELKEVANLITNFETHIENGLLIPTKHTGPSYFNDTYINGENVSHLYDEVKGTDELLRIYDLYNGVVNRRNIYDIHNVNLGILRADAFHLKEVKGIMQKEDSLVSNNIGLNEYYIKYQNLLKSISPSGEVLLENRKSLLDSMRISRCHKDDLEARITMDMLFPNSVNEVLEKLKKKINRKQIIKGKNSV